MVYPSVLLTRVKSVGNHDVEVARTTPRCSLSQQRFRCPLIMAYLIAQESSSELLVSPSFYYYMTFCHFPDAEGAVAHLDLCTLRGGPSSRLP